MRDRPPLLVCSRLDAMNGMLGSNSDAPTWGCAVVKDPIEVVRGKVRRWLQEEEWQVQEKTHHPEARWLFAAGSRDDRAAITVGQRANRQDKISIELQIVFTNANRFALMPLDRRKSTVVEITSYLLLANLEWRGLNLEPTDLFLMSSIYYDGLTKDVFFQRVRALINASVLVRSSMSLLLDDALADFETEDRN